MSRAGRAEVRGHVTDLAVAAMREYWENEGFAAVPDLSSRDSSIRRSTFDSYAAAVDLE